MKFAAERSSMHHRMRQRLIARRGQTLTLCRAAATQIGKASVLVGYVSSNALDLQIEGPDFHFPCSFFVNWPYFGRSLRGLTHCVRETWAGS